MAEVKSEEKEMTDQMKAMSIEGASPVQSASSFPKVEFIEDIESYMKLPENAEAQAVLRRMEDVYSKIKLIESTLYSRKKMLKGQIIDFTKTVEIIEELKRRKSIPEDMSTHFKLADHVYVKAKVKPVENVGLWLGANIMLEYQIDEGEKLLITKRDQAETTLKNTNESLDVLREQITTIEVNMARIYNYDVMRRKAERDAAMAKSSS